MCALYLVIVITAFFCHTSAKTPIQNDSLTYECTKNGTIVITAQSKGEYGSVYAAGMRTNDSHSMCTVDRYANATMMIFTVRNCNVSLPINVTVMKEQQNSTEDMILGGSNVTLYELKCSDVRLGGLNITKSFNISESDTLKINQAHQKEVNMTMTILNIKNQAVGPSTTVVIGEELQLIIGANSGYILFAKSCSATDEAKNHSKQLILNGNTQDSSLISSFSNHSDPTHAEIKAALYAFHFLKTNTISIICNITVCIDDDSSCPFNSHSNSNSTRRKRSAFTEPETKTLETSFRVIDSYTTPVHKTYELHMSGSSTERRSLTVSLIFVAAIGLARTLP